MLASTFWDDAQPLAAGQVFVLAPQGIHSDTAEAVHREELLVVDLSDEWAPFIFSESGGPSGPVKPNPYRKAYLDLANDRASPEELLMETRQGELAALSAAGISAEKGAAETPEGRRAIAEDIEKHDAGRYRWECERQG